jgi:hypothetical protein
MGTGLNTSTVPVLQSELSKAHLRGKMVMAEMTITIFGISVANWVDCEWFQKPERIPVLKVIKGYLLRLVGAGEPT